MQRWGVDLFFFGFWVHKVYALDQQLWHTHFNSFLSMLIHGAYAETKVVAGREVKGYYTAPAFNFIRYDTPHIVVSKQPFWTFCITGPKRHDWYFLRNGRKIPWRKLLVDYVK